MKFPKTVPAAWIRTAKAGDSIICQGHTSYSRVPLVRAKAKFSTHQAWLVLLSKEYPEPVTVITLLESLTN